MDSYIPRKIENKIKEYLFRGKILIVYGPRRSGKTTLVKKILDEYGGTYFNCEEPYVQSAFGDNSSAVDLKRFLGKGKVIVLDEARVISNIGRKLKILIDSYPDLNIIATGSSSFDLANTIVEPLTGRKIEFTLYPLSIEEVVDAYGWHEVESKLQSILRYGLYPSVFVADEMEVETILKELSGSYLFKDILQFQGIKNSDVLRKMLQALALQLGNEISFNELGNLVGIDKNTVMKYLDLLEKSFVIFRLTPFSRNLRKELSKNRKIYFYDIGIRNAILNQFNHLELRSDVGALWENFCILERKKFLDNNKIFCNHYFWRTYDQKEIDLIEERDGTFRIFEFKYSKDDVSFPTDWLDNYPTSKQLVINKKNYSDLLVP